VDPRAHAAGPSSVRVEPTPIGARLPAAGVPAGAGALVASLQWPTELLALTDS
jgi:hypothetical protein